MGQYPLGGAVPARAAETLSVRGATAITCLPCRGSRRSSGCRLLLEALARPEAAGITCLIAGEGEERPALQRAIDTWGLAGRVRLLGRIGEEALLDHLARCRAVCFLPCEEDYGFVTVEAFSSRKPVVTCSDSGGPAELVVDGVNGRVLAPRPEAWRRRCAISWTAQPPPGGWARPGTIWPRR